MVYLKTFELLKDIDEHNILTAGDIKQIYNNYYPLHIYSNKQLDTLNFNDITIFYGGNGSGKTTLLNIISKKIGAQKKTSVNNSSYFNLYVDKCKCEMNTKRPTAIKHISSDDVFEYLLDIKFINLKINNRKDELCEEYLSNKFEKHDNNFSDYEEIKNICDAKRKNMSKYVRDRLFNNNIIENSNGETALMFWQKEINENAIYLLDEPENSLSSENQLKLKKFIEESVRFYNCQFIISTHSPFLLSLKDSKIYDLDSTPVITKKWTELPNVRTYYDFFQEYSEDFK